MGPLKPVTVCRLLGQPASAFHWHFTVLSLDLFFFFNFDFILDTSLVAQR